MIRCRLGLTLISLSVLTACRSDFSVMTCDGQKEVFASSTDLFGWREFMFQYDAESCMLYSSQPFVDVGDVKATVIRAYSLQDGLKEEWYVSDYVDNDYSPAVILDGKVYIANLREWDGKVVDNIRVVDLSDGERIHNSHPITGLLPASTSCTGMMRIGRNQILLKLLDVNSFVPSIALFDPAAQRILKKLELGGGDDGRYVWGVSSDRFRLSVSENLKWLVLRNKNGALTFYDSSLNENKTFALKELLRLNGADAHDFETYRSIRPEWVGNDIVVLWSWANGRWWNLDGGKGRVLKEGKLNLRKRSVDSVGVRDCYNKTEYIQCALGRTRFLVKGFEEGLFSKEGYIVEVGLSGEERRFAVKRGTWPKKLLTEECYYAESY